MMFFESATRGADGALIEMYSVVTPVVPVTQTYHPDEPPMVLEPGIRCLVVGAANGDTSLLWVEVDQPGEFAGANILVPSQNLEQFSSETG